MLFQVEPDRSNEMIVTENVPHHSQNRRPLNEETIFQILVSHPET